MTTKLQIFQGAALILKEPASTLTVTTDSVLVNTFVLEYDKVIATILESGRWNFAARSLSIEADESVEPEFGYTFAFEKPEDYRNLIKIAASSTFYPPMDPNTYVDEGNHWFANVDPIYVSIVSDDASHGGDLSLWPEVVARAAEYELAFRVAPHVTSMGEQAMDMLEKRKEKALRRAESWDASKQPPESMPPSRLATARSSARSGWRHSWRW